ncbi:MAG: hypothetical protein L6R36_001628 [Xanthoria steineri]|nr:MAG: hypothetical protein L6R36_001628 [Xanthoria steineri]
MDDPRNQTPNSWLYPSRPSSNISYNHVGPSNSSSPVHAAPFVPMYPSPHGTQGPFSERQRQIMELNPHNRQNFAPQHATNGGGHHTGYSNYPTPTTFQPQNVPALPPADGLNDKQRQARDLITQLNQDKKVVLEARKKTAAELQRRITELEDLEDSQCASENLRYIYPLQMYIAKKQAIHDGYGREWDKVQELLEICWAELMAPAGG